MTVKPLLGAAIGTIVVLSAGTSAAATGPRCENSTDYPAGTPPPPGNGWCEGPEVWDWYWGGDQRMTAEDPYSDPYTAG
jgi:hypothetical protein